MFWWGPITILDCVLIGVLLLILLYIYLMWNYDYFKKRGIPYRKPVPLFGNIASQMLRKQSMAESVLEDYNYFKGYSVAGMFHFRTPAYVIRDPELLKLIFVKDFDHFMNHTLELPDGMEPLMSANLLQLKGQKWRHMRNTLSPAFSSSKMKMMFHLVSACGQQLVDYLESLIKDPEDVLEFDMKDLLTKFTNDVIATSAFGISCDSLNNPTNEFYKCGKEISNFRGFRALVFMGYFFCPRLMSLLNLRMIRKANEDFLRATVRETIKTREKQGIVRPDMIHLLMEAAKGELKDDEEETKEATPSKETKEESLKLELSEMDITAQATVFFLAGFETAATMLGFATILLATHTDIQERLQEEIDQTLEKCKGKITYEALHGMKYLDMVISETMRMYPSVPANDRDVVKPYIIPASDNLPEIRLTTEDKIFIPVYGIHHDPEYFPDPEKFDPERFSDENKQNIKPYTYMPFGTGPRVCIGNRFALMEMKIALTYLLSRFTLQVTEKSPVPIVLAKDSFQMAPDKGFWAGIKLRGKRN